MKWSFAAVGLIIIGLFGIMIIVLFHEITVSNEQDYFTLKEATEASMIEAVDTTYYRLTGKIKMSAEKFVENFTQRFTKSATFGQGNYYIEFYQIIEYPAKVSLRIVDATNSYSIFTSFDDSLGSTQTNIVNELSAILDGYETTEALNSGIFRVNKLWQYIDANGNIIPKPSSNAVMPILKCEGYDKNKHKELSFDIPNGICSYLVEKDASYTGPNKYETKTAEATIECPEGILAKGWCLT